MDVSKLPKWAQDRIASLERRVDELARELDRTLDTAQPTPYSAHFYVGNERKTRYVDAPYGIEVTIGDVCLLVKAEDGVRSQRCAAPHLYVQWSGRDRTMRELAFIPESFQSARIQDPRHCRI